MKILHLFQSWAHPSSFRHFLFAFWSSIYFSHYLSASAISIMGSFRHRSSARWGAWLVVMFPQCGFHLIHPLYPWSSLHPISRCFRVISACSWCSGFMHSKCPNYLTVWFFYNCIIISIIIMLVNKWIRVVQSVTSGRVFRMKKDLLAEFLFFLKIIFVRMIIFGSLFVSLRFLVFKIPVSIPDLYLIIVLIYICSEGSLYGGPRVDQRNGGNS